MFGQFTLIIFSSVTISVKNRFDGAKQSSWDRCFNFYMVASMAVPSGLFLARILCSCNGNGFRFTRKMPCTFSILQCSMFIEAAISFLSDQLKIISNIFRHHFNATDFIKSKQFHVYGIFITARKLLNLNGFIRKVFRFFYAPFIAMYL